MAAALALERSIPGRGERRRQALAPHRAGPAAHHVRPGHLARRPGSPGGAVCRRCRVPVLVPARRCRVPAVPSNARLVSTRQAGDVGAGITCANIALWPLRLTAFRVPTAQRPRNRGPIVRRSGVFSGIGPFHAPPACVGQEVRAGRPEASPVRSSGRRRAAAARRSAGSAIRGPVRPARPPARDSVSAARAPEGSALGGVGANDTPPDRLPADPRDRGGDGRLSASRRSPTR